jgi:hypothetical protein
MSASLTNLESRGSGLFARWWRRRWFRVVVRVVAIAIVLRVVLALAMPWLLDVAAGTRGLTCSYDKLDLALLRGSVEVRNLQLRVRETEHGSAAPPLLALEFAKVDVNVLETLFGKPTVDRAEVDGLHVLAEVGRDGSIEWLRVLGMDRPPAPESKPVPEPAPLDLTSPVLVNALRLHDVEVHVLDRTLEPPFDARITTELRVSDLGRSNQFELRATSPELFDQLRVDADATSGPRALDARLQVELAGLHAAQLRGEMARAGPVPIAREIAFSGSFLAQIGPRADSDLDCNGNLTVRDIAVTHDGIAAFALDELVVDVERFDAERVDVAQISVNGVRGAVGRSVDGALNAAGIELGAAPASSAPSVATASAASPSAPFAATCARLAIKNAALSFHDQAVAPASDLPLVLDELSVENLAFDPARADPSTRWLVRAHADGIAQTIVAEGSAKLAWPRVESDLRVDVGDIDAARLAPYLEQLGLASNLHAARLQTSATLAAQFGPDGRLEADLHVGAIDFTDGADKLFSLDGAQVGGLVVDPAQHLFKAASIDIGGTRLALRRDADGALHALGLSTLAQPTNAAVGEANPAANGARSPQLPRIEIGSFKWHDNAFELADDTAQPPLKLSVRNVGVQLDGVALGEERVHAATEPARVRAWLGIDGILGEAALDGTLATHTDERDARLTLALRAKGIDTTSLAPYLAPLGIEPTLKDGSFVCDVTAVAKLGDDALDADLDVSHVELRGEEGVIASMRSFHIAEAHLGGGAWRCSTIALEQPVARLKRSADGAWLALGVRVAPAAKPVDETPRSLWQRLDALCAPFELPAIQLGEFKVNQAHLRVDDATLTPPPVFHLEAHVSVRDVSTAAGAPPASYDGSLAIGQTLGAIVSSGTFSLDPHALALRGRLEMRELDTARLLPYFPSGLSSQMQHGWFETHFDVQLADAAEGGRKASCVLDDLRGGDDANKWCAQFDQFALRVARLDPKARVLDVDELSLAGAKVRIARLEPTKWSAFGIEFDTAPAAARAAAAAPARPAPRAIDRGAPATIRLGKLDLGVADLSIFDRTLGDQSRSIETSLRVSTGAPSVLIDGAPEALPPLALNLHAAFAPLVQGIDAELRLSPWLAQPEFDATLAVSGIDGARILERLPQLPLAIDGAQLTHGTFGAHAHGELRLERSAPTEFDASKPFGAEFDVDHVAFRAEPGGEVLAGLDGAHVDIARVDPASGDIAIKSIELTKPIGRVERAADGLHVLGLVIPLPSTEAAPSAANAEAPAPAPEVSPAPAAPVAESAPPSGSDVRVDRLTISGLDFVARDTSVSPPVELPLDALDVDVRKLSTRALREGQAFKFNAFVGAGKLTLPRRVESDSLLEGMAAATADVLTGAQEVSATEQRPLFDEVAIAGNLAVAPRLSGWATVDVAALELPSFRGIAKQLGVEIGDGVLDQSLRVRFQGEQGLSVDSRSTFSHLSLSEPANGPIERYLALPAPLDSVLFLLKDFEGQHKVPISFRVTQAGLSSGEIAAAAVSATATVIATAIASSPLRLAGTLTDLFGITGGEEPPPSKDALTVDFDPGASGLSASEREAIAKLAAKLASKSKLVVSVVHDFGGGDIARALQLGNPALDDCRQLSLQLRQKKAELERRRAELAAEARVGFALGGAQQAQALSQRLRALDAEIGLNEDALDRLHELLKPGAERRREQRARTAALSIASERVARVRQALLDSGLAPERIEVRQVRVGATQGDGGGHILLAPHERKP